jgi:prepilin-type N-terminal cleavage/methylation domain-containing protein
MSRQRGYTLIEMLVTVAVIGLFTTISLASLTNILWRAALRGAAVRIVGLMAMTREDAVALRRARAIKFLRERDGGWSYAIYADGDDDGVLNEDIAKGIDKLVQGPDQIVSPRALATIGIPPRGLPDPDGGARISPDASPVQFNRSMLCSFSADGSGTPGSIYLRTVAGDAAVVRCSGDGGRVSILLLNRLMRMWRSFS